MCNKKKLLVGLATGFFVFCVVGLANAIPITQEFFVEIDSINISSNLPSGTIYDPVAAMEQYPTPLGSKIYGSVTYDDSLIPENGDYYIAHSFFYNDPYFIPSHPIDEYQNWGIDWLGATVYGFCMICETDIIAQLRFMDGKLSGIDDGWHADFDGGLRDEYFLNTDFVSRGELTYGALLPSGDWAVFFDAYFNTHGNLYIVSVPDASIMLLLGSSLMGLGVFSRKSKRS